MQIHQIEYIIEVAKTRSISEAALNLNVSVATISQSLSNFEKQYGIKLFNRSRLGTQPTEQGKRIIEKAFNIKKQLVELEKEAKFQSLIIDKELRIICSPTTLTTFLPKAIADFSKQHPNTEIIILEKQNVIGEILNNEYDLGFQILDEITWIKEEKSHKNILHFNTICQGKLFVCVNKTSPLAFREAITPKDLLDQTIILPSISKVIYNDILNQYGPIKVLFETYNMETIKKAITEGIGISFLSEFNIKNDERFINGQIIAIPLENYERSNLTCGYIRPKDRYFSTAASSFLQIINSMDF